MEPLNASKIIVRMVRVGGAGGRGGWEGCGECLAVTGSIKYKSLDLVDIAMDPIE